MGKMPDSYDEIPKRNGRARLWSRVLSRFFDQVGQKTKLTSSGN